MFILVMIFRAINVLLDGGYECADVVLETADLLEDEYKETTSEQLPPEELVESSSEISMTHEIEPSEASQTSPTDEASGSTEETEALRRHIEGCFQLTDTLSEHARRVSGKDYSQFRASQLQKLRHAHSTSQLAQFESTSEQGFWHGVPFDETMPPLEASLPSEIDDQLDTSQYAPGTTGFLDFQLLETYQIPQPSNDELVEEEAMVPITLDPLFINQLIALFGPPDSQTDNCENSQKHPANFEIPWSLAEQLYLYWCSSLVKDDAEEIPSEEESNYREESESRGLNNIMDIEYAMKLVEEEVCYCIVYRFLFLIHREL